MKPTDIKNQATAKRPRATSSRGGGLMKRLSTDPFIDWAIIVVGAMIASLSLVAVGVSVYLDTGAKLSAAPVVSPAVSESGFSRDKLTQVIDEFAGRVQTTESLIKGYTAGRDPSLP